MKKFFSNLSNKNKLMISCFVAYLSESLGMLVCSLTLVPYPLVAVISIITGESIFNLIRGKYYDKYKSSYCDELSNKFFESNKDNIKIVDERMNKETLVSVRKKIITIEFCVMIAAFLLLFYMLICSVPGVSVCLGTYYAFIILADNFIDKLNINLSVVNNVINRIEASQLEANHNNDSANELGKNNTVSNQLSNRYVPGVSPTITEIMNRYNCDKSRRGPVRARRKPEDNRR